MDTEELLSMSRALRDKGFKGPNDFLNELNTKATPILDQININTKILSNMPNFEVIKDFASKLNENIKGFFDYLDSSKYVKKYFITTRNDEFLSKSPSIAQVSVILKDFEPKSLTRGVGINPLKNESNTREYVIKDFQINFYISLSKIYKLLKFKSSENDLENLLYSLRSETTSNRVSEFLRENSFGLRDYVIFGKPTNYDIKGIDDDILNNYKINIINLFNLSIVKNDSEELLYNIDDLVENNYGNIAKKIIENMPYIVSTSNQYLYIEDLSSFNKDSQYCGSNNYNNEYIHISDIHNNEDLINYYSQSSNISLIDDKRRRTFICYKDIADKLDIKIEKEDNPYYNEMEEVTENE